MFTSVARQNPVEPKYPLTRVRMVNIAVCLPSRNCQIAVSAKVDPEGFEPSSEQRTSHTLRFFFVNVLMISQNIRFKAILRLSDAFLTLLWVADPLKDLECLERTF